MKRIFTSMNTSEKVLFSIYTLFSLWLFFSLVGIFNTVTVALTIVVLALFIWLTRGKEKSTDKIIHWLWLAVPLILVGWLLLRGFYTGDAYAFWLPWARDIALSGSMPDWISHTRIPYVSAGPFLTLSLAAVFTILPLNQFSVVLLPIFFFVLTMVIMVYWMREKSISANWIWVAVILVIFNSQTAFWSWNLLTESLLLLSFTLFFYCYERVWSLVDSDAKDEMTKRWLFLLASFCLAILIKFSSVALIVLLLLVLFKQRKIFKLRILPILFLVASPLIIWLARNYILYDNPVYPLLNGLFGGEYASLYQLTNPFQYWLDRYTTVWSRARFILSEFIIIYPLAIFAFVGMWKSKFSIPHILALIVALSAGIFIIFSESSGMRYLWPYITLMAVYAAVGLRETHNRLLKTGLLAAALSTILLVLPVESTSSFISSLEKLAYPLGVIAQGLHNYWWVVILVLLPVLYIVSKREFAWQYLSVIVLSTGLLHTRWIENKSFLNTWTFIIIVLILILLVSFLPRVKKKTWLLVGGVYLLSLFFINSYAQASIYYMRHDLTWPHTHINETSIVLSELLERQNIPLDEVFVTLNGASYFQWYDARVVYQLNTFEFFRLTDKFYTQEMNAGEFYELLKSADVNIVVQVSSNHNEPLWDSTEQLLNSQPDFFQRECDDAILDVCVWKLIEQK